MTHFFDLIANWQESCLVVRHETIPRCYTSPLSLCVADNIYGDEQPNELGMIIGLLSCELVDRV